MALKKETLTKIATLLKVTEADLDKAIKDEKEVDLAIDDKLQVFTDTDLVTLRNNEYNRGKDAGADMEIKEAKTKYGLDFPGKTIEGLLGAYKAKVMVDEKLTPDEKAKEYETKIATLTKTVTDQEKAMAAKEAEVSGIRINGELYKHIPVPGENGPSLNQDEIIQLMKANGYEFKQEKETLNSYKGGQLLVDKLGNALPAKDVVTSFLTDKKIVTPVAGPGGRGGNDKVPPGKITKMSELKAKFTAEGKSLNGQEFSAAYTEAAKDKDFDPNS